MAESWKNVKPGVERGRASLDPLSKHFQHSPRVPSPYEKLLHFSPPPTPLLPYLNLKNELRNNEDNDAFSNTPILLLPPTPSSTTHPILISSTFTLPSPSFPPRDRRFLATPNSHHPLYPFHRIGVISIEIEIL